jgi:large subunit ribosomal protein L9
MDVILLQDVDKLGAANEMVKVRSGYARNYLFPQKLAVVADESQKKQLTERQKQDDRREEKMLQKINDVQEQLKSVTYTVGAKTGTSGKIFGAVTTIQLAHAIKKQSGITVDRKKISFNEEIEALGNYTANVHLHKDVLVTVNFEVVAD